MMILPLNAFQLFRLHKRNLNSNINIIRGMKLNPDKQYTRQSFRKNGRQESGDIYLQAIGTGAHDQPSTLHLFTPQKSYLFNCTENIGRYCIANAASSNRVKHIFFTQLKWHFIGGITSLLFAILSKYGHFPTFHGSPKLFNIIKELNFLSIVGDTFKYTLRPEIINSTNSYEDDCIRIDSVQLFKNNTNSISNSNDGVVNTYVCKIKARPGSFSSKKSVEKNVPPGELFQKIFDGQDIVLDDGTIVRAEDVRQPSVSEKYFMVIDVPSTSFLTGLSDNKRMKEVLDNIKPNHLDLIVHFTPDHVFNTKEYQDIISQFNAKRHSLMNDTNRYSALPKVHRIVAKLHSVDPKIHPMLGMLPDPAPVIYDTTSESCHELDTAPKLYTKYFFHHMMDKKSTNAKTFEDEEINGINIHLRNEPENQLSNEVFPNIVFLGTGSACSQVGRNASGILVNISETHSILLDCGEGICSQIFRFYGSRSPQIFRRIRAIFVSHTHLDHHIGLPEMFRMRNLYLPKHRIPLVLIGPVDELKSWFHFYSNEMDDIESDMQMIANGMLKTERGLHHHMCKKIGIVNLRTCRVPHNKDSHAVTLNLPIRNEMFKLTYSGDTQSSDELVQLAQKSSLLIHEASFQDELEHMATQKKHSTISQAILQAQKSNAKYTILTHFSGRYRNIPYFEGNLPQNIGIAFDFMRITLDDLPRLNALYPKYREIFQTDIQNLERKTIKYKANFPIR